MLRGLLILLFAGVSALVMLPFLMSSLYIDQRGVTIPGHVYSKREDAIIQYSTWYRSCEVTFEYWGPEESGVSFLKVELPPDQYDSFSKGQQVQLHYLRRQDVPTLPLVQPLRAMGLLPKARLARQRVFSGFLVNVDRIGFPVVGALAGSVLLLILWRVSRLPGFQWAVVACVLGVLTLVLISEFPLPTPGPSAGVRIASAKVKSAERIERLFSGSRTRGEIAAEPVKVVGAEFVPEGRSEAVLAVDLIDESSLVVKPGDIVALEYESAAPRTAHLQRATRSFPRRNLAGIAVTFSIYVALLLGFLFGAHYLGRGWKRLLASRN